MSDLAFPEIIEQPTVASAPAAELVDRAEIKGGNVLVAYSRTEAALVDLRNRFKGATFDLTTTAGDKAARGARLELVTLRTGLEKKRKEFKTPALEFGRRIDAEASRITSEIEALEKPIDDQIKADERRRAEEKAERDRIEAERVSKHESGIAKIRSYAAAAQGLPSERIAKGIAALESMTFGPDWEEFAVPAANAQCETIEALKGILAKAVEAEQAAEKARLDRIELERLRAEQAARDAIAQQVKTLNSLVSDCLGKTAETISLRVDLLARTIYSEGVAAEVLTTHEAVLAQLRTLLEAARKQEDDARELAALRAAQQSIQAPPVATVVSTPEPEASAGAACRAEEPKETTQRGAVTEGFVPTSGAGDDAKHDGRPALADGPSLETSEADAVEPPREVVLAAMEAGIDEVQRLLRDTLTLVEFLRAPFTGKFPTQPKVGTEWWANLREQLDAIEPRLQYAVGIPAGEA